MGKTRKSLWHRHFLLPHLVFEVWEKTPGARTSATEEE
jgi:hypothetical protein